MIIERKNYKKIISDVIRDRQLYLLLVPFLLFYLIFEYKPMYGLQIAFKDYSLYKGIEASEWVGLKHFINFFQGEYFLRLLKNTFMINVYAIVFGFPVPIILALLFNEIRNVKYKSFLQTLTYLPHFVSAVVVAGMVVNFLAPSNGLINLIIERLGGEKVYFLIKPKYFRGIYTIMNIWKESGFGAIIYIAALTGINTELYEAASIDGANKWKQTLHVTIPGILPTIMIMLILKISRILNVGFETIILLYQPATYETSDVISTFVYRMGLKDAQYDLATAVGVFNALVALILVSISNKISKKITEVGIW